MAEGEVGGGGEGGGGQSHVMGMLCHLLGIFTWFIGPLIIWLIKKGEDPFVDSEGKEALNFQISWTLYLFVSLLLTAVAIGAILYPLIWIAGLVLMIIASVKSSKGESYKYPLILRLIK